MQNVNMEEDDDELLIINHEIGTSTSDEVEEEDVKNRSNFSIEELNGDINGESISEVQQNVSTGRQKLWELNYQEAAIYLQEGTNNDKFSAHPRKQADLPAYLITHNTWFHVVDLVTSLVLLGLVLIESPAVIKVNVGIHGSLELLCLLLITLKSALKMYWLGFEAFFKHWMRAIKTICLVVMIMEAITVLARQTSHVRVTRAIRPLFLLDSYYLKGVRRFIRHVVQSLPAIFDMLVLLLFFMLLFSLLGFYLFCDIPNDQYFRTIQESFVSMFILLTTANFPDVMLPSYDYNRFSAIFFVIYLSTELYLFMNLFLAVVYDAFQKIEKSKLKNLLLHKRSACREAFKLLVSKQNSSCVSLTQFVGLMKCHCPNMSRRDCYLTFKSLNTSQSGKLSLEEFYNIYVFTSLKWKARRPENYLWFVSFRFPVNAIFKGIHSFVCLKWFDYFIYVVIIINFLWIIGDTIAISVERNADHPPDWISSVHQYIWCSSIFVGIYVLEAALKILGFGPRKYFSSGWNIFDFLVTAISAVGVLLEFVSQTFYYFLVFRPLRLLRLFKLKRRYRDVLGTLFILASRMVSISIVMLVVYYFFAIIGMELFSHKDMKNCCVNTTVEMFFRYDNETGTGGYYYLNNFDNVFMTAVTLFEMTVVNNWYIIMDGYAAVYTEWSRIYFMTFYIVTMVILTVVVSFILEAFLFRIQYRNTMKGHDLDEDAIMKVDVTLRPCEVAMCHNKALPLSPHFIAPDSQRNAVRPEDPQCNTVFRGERLRSKDDFSIIMYKQEVMDWIEQSNSTEGQETVIKDD